MAVPLNQRQQQVECFGSERDGLAVAQQEVFRRIEAEGAEFVDVLWLMAHHSANPVSSNRESTMPPITGSATLEHKYPECRNHAASTANHPEPIHSKAQKPRLLSGDPS